MGTYQGKRGDDTIVGSRKPDYIYGHEGSDTLSGGDGDDRIYGGIGNDRLNGDAGRDQLYGDAGNDRLDGGTGNDSLFGGDGDDHLLGGEGNDALTNGAGNDILEGGAGLDELHLGPGNDLLTGGAGDDRFVITFNAGFTATITDFDRDGDDILWFMPNQDANPSLSGNQKWYFAGSDAPTSARTDGHGQATVSYEGSFTVLRLYNADGDLNADVTVNFAGLYAAEELQIQLYDPLAYSWRDPGIIFA